MTYSTQFPHQEVALAVQTAEEAKTPLNIEEFRPATLRVTPAEKISMAAQRAGKEADYDAMDVMADAMFDENLPQAARVAIAKELLPYTYGKQPKAAPLGEQPDVSPQEAADSWDFLKGLVDAKASRKAKEYLDTQADIVDAEVVEDRT